MMTTKIVMVTVKTVKWESKYRFVVVLFIPHCPYNVEDDPVEKRSRFQPAIEMLFQLCQS